MSVVICADEDMHGRAGDWSWLRVGCTLNTERARGGLGMIGLDDIFPRHKDFC